MEERLYEFSVSRFIYNDYKLIQAVKITLL